MNKTKSLFLGSLFLIIVFAMIVLVALIYRAKEQSRIKSYIFQMNNYANERVGDLQDINNITPNDLRNKLIKKYISEYFKVIPGETNVDNRPVLANMSSAYAFSQWQQGEAKTIQDLSDKKMFRMVRVQNDGIATVSNMKGIDYKSSATAQKVYYEVRYYLLTWPDSNLMETEPVLTKGTVYLEIRFKTGIKPDISVREYLERGKDPSGLFKFEVTNVGDKEDL